MVKNNFKFDEEPISEVELDYIGSFLLRRTDLNVFVMACRRSIKGINKCCKDCPTVKAMRAVFRILTRWNTMKPDQRLIDLYDINKYDMMNVCKYITGMIECEGTLDAIEESKDNDKINEAIYINLMDTMKHIHAVKSRYWFE